MCKVGDCALIVSSVDALAVNCDLCSFLGGNEGKPDFIVLELEEKGVRRRWIVVEFEKTIHHVTKIVKQIADGVNVISNSPGFPSMASDSIFPLVIYGDGVHTADLQRIGNQYVMFHGRKIGVRFKKRRVDILNLGW